MKDREAHELGRGYTVPEETEDSWPPGSPFLRPSFMAAAVLVLVIAILGVVIAIRVAGAGDEGRPAAAASPSGAATPSQATGPGSSICGLPAPPPSEDIPEAPAAVGPPAVWRFEDTIAYPVSQEFGPGKTAPEGYRYCFQESPTGALFAAANAVAHGGSADEAMVGSWADYFVSQGTGRASILAELSQPRSDSGGVRMSIVGFRMLSYTGTTARVDISLRTSGSAQTVYASAVYELEWVEGDWRLNSDAPKPFSFATIPDIDGYVQWGE